MKHTPESLSTKTLPELDDPLPCPFCGGSDLKFSIGWEAAAMRKSGAKRVMSMNIDCLSCGTRKLTVKLFKTNSYEQARRVARKQIIKEWNTRVTIAAILAAQGE